jgi:hypothetical protein
MLAKIVCAPLIVILMVGVASAQSGPGDLQNIQGGENSFRTEKEKKDDRAIDRAYESTMKRIPTTQKKNSDPWGDVRAAPATAPKNKQQ